jgi:hypothetical protein
MAFKPIVLLITACTAASGKLLAKPALPSKPVEPRVFDNALSLRGGGPTLPEIAVGTNGAAYLGYGIAMIFATNTILASYGIEGQDFLSPTVGAFQYLGGLYLMIALRAYATLVAKVRDVKHTLEAFLYANTTLFLIALYRAYSGSAQSKKNVGMFGVMAALSYYGWAAA